MADKCFFFCNIMIGQDMRWYQNVGAAFPCYTFGVEIYDCEYLCRLSIYMLGFVLFQYNTSLFP